MLTTIGIIHKFHKYVNLCMLLYKVLNIL